MNGVTAPVGQGQASLRDDACFVRSLPWAKATRLPSGHRDARSIIDSTGRLCTRSVDQGFRVECSMIQYTSRLLAEGTFSDRFWLRGGVVLGSFHLWISEWPSANANPPAFPW